ncbi:hypothetical protein C8R44DRAFT_885171 [Mycena epipterygia]|nr:hypothetical protein C8R44DRAFT_885171 [Mycena epipterygia]
MCIVGKLDELLHIGHQEGQKLSIMVRDAEPLLCLPLSLEPGNPPREISFDVSSHCESQTIDRMGIPFVLDQAESIADGAAIHRLLSPNALWKPIYYQTPADETYVHVIGNIPPRTDNGEPSLTACLAVQEKEADGKGVVYVKYDCSKKTKAQIVGMMISTYLTDTESKLALVRMKF